MKICVSNHAFDRYRQRINRNQHGSLMPMFVQAMTHGTRYNGKEGTFVMHYRGVDYICKNDNRAVTQVLTVYRNAARD